MPLGQGAQRVVGALSGVWTNGHWRFITARELLYRAATDSDPMYVPSSGPYPFLDLTHLEEDPELLRSEAKISNLGLGRAMRRPQLSVREILHYRQLHPEIRADLAALLSTQLHARLAAPWTCLVVVLIAIPFGAPSGRRNIFYGVAGSIGIAFGYFVVQRVGYALAQNGQLAAWLGAWMPNLVFGTLGAVLISRVR
jgi:lipopolysaccharide export LptBFGC system permease protein LptF